jgi:enoyl-CoA hydratase/carnithine racemase
LFFVEKQGAVALVEYRNPPHGFLTLAAIAQLKMLFRELERDAGVRVIVISGTMVHTELDEISTMLRMAARIPRFLIPLVAFFARWLSPVHATFSAVARSKKITIAAIDGPCIGGGLELSLCCDYRFATEESVLGCPEIRMGLLPGFGGSQRLLKLIGAARTRGLLLSGELLIAREAERIGIVCRVLSIEEMRQRAQSLARRPPLAVAAIKRATFQDIDIARELDEVMRVARTDDVALGLEYRRALNETREIDQLMAKMEEVEFSGGTRGSLRPSRAS